MVNPAVERIYQRRRRGASEAPSLPKPKMSEGAYREVISRAEKGRIPLYPALIRRKALTHYKAEKIAELKRKQQETKEKIRIAQALREEAQQHAEWEAKWGAKEVKEVQIKPGGWVRINPDGSVSQAGFAAFSPSEAKALGYKWGTTAYKKDKATGDREIVFVPMPKPTEAEFYGVRKWKLERGQYAHDPALEKRIRKEVEIGGEKFGITAPAWARGYLREYEAAAKTIRAAYRKAAEAEKKPTPTELKKAGTPPPTPRPVTKQDVSKYHELTTLGQHPDIQAHIAAMQKLQTESEQLQTRGIELQRQTKAQKELVAGADKAFEEYAKGGWTPEEAVSYGFLAGTVRGAGKELEPKLVEYREKAKRFETLLKQPKSSVIEQFEGASKAFMEQYSPTQIAEMEKAMIVTFPDEKPPSPTKEPEITYGGLGQIIRAGGGVIPMFTLSEEPETRPTATERLVEKGKQITGYYPEKGVEYGATISAYGAQQLGLADSLGVTHRVGGMGKRYIIVNDTKYTEGTEGFDEHLGEAIQTGLGLFAKQPTEVKTRQEAIQKAKRLKTEFTDIYGGEAGEPIILLTPESQKAFKKLEATFEGIPEETVTTKAYWKEVEKMREVHPQIEELNVLAGQATHQAKEMEKIQEKKLFGIPHKVETTEEKYSPYIKKLIPPIRPYAQVESAEDFVKAFETTHIHAYERKGLEAPPLTEQKQKEMKEAWEEGQRISRDYRKMWGLSPEPYEWERKAGQLRAGFVAGGVEEIREHPIKGAVTIASFAALPSVFKGAGYLWGARAGGAAVGMAAKVPRLTKWVPRIATGGMMAGYGGVAGLETYEAPTMELKGEVLGRTSVELAEMGAGMYLGMKTMPSYIKGIEVSAEGAVRSYKGLGIGKTGRPVIGMFKETIKTPEVTAMQRALVLGEKYPALRYLMKTQKAEAFIPGIGGEKGWRVPVTRTMKEWDIGRAIRYERGSVEGYFARQTKGLIPETIGEGGVGIDVFPAYKTVPKGYRWLEGWEPKGLITETAGMPPGARYMPEPFRVRGLKGIPRYPRTADWSSLFEYGKPSFRALKGWQPKGLITETAGQPPSAKYIHEQFGFKTRARKLIGEGEKLELGDVFKPQKRWGIRIEKPEIPTWAEIVAGRQYSFRKGYSAFQIGEHPSYLKILGLAKKPKPFGKGVEEFVHPFHKKFGGVYKPSMLDYQPLKGLLTEGRILDMARAKIRPSERPLSPIEKLYQRRTPEDIFRDFGFGEKPTAGMKEVLKPIETRFLKFTKEGELIPQPELKKTTSKAKRGVAVKPEVIFDFEVATETALSRVRANAARLFEQKKEPKIGKAKEKKRLGFELSPPEAFGKTPKHGKGVGAAFWHSLVSTPDIVPIITPYEEEKEGAIMGTKGFVFLGYEVAFKPIATTIPKEKEHVKVKPFPSVSPEFVVAPIPEVEILPRGEPAPKPAPSPLPPRFEPPPQIPTTFIEPPIIPPILLPPLSSKKKTKRKKHTKKHPYEWFVKHPIPTLEEMFGQPAYSKTRHRVAIPDGTDMMNRVLNGIPEGFK